MNRSVPRLLFWLLLDPMLDLLLGLDVEERLVLADLEVRVAPKELLFPPLSNEVSWC